jgi:aspartate racemase
MTNDETKLINRRDALAMLGAIGISGMVRVNAPGKGFKTRDENQKALIGADEGDDKDKAAAMKTIGVLGGLGAQATMDFESRVHKVAQRLIPQRQNSGYPPMFVCYYRHPPILLNADFSPRLPVQPDPRLLEAAKRTGASADFLVVTSNGAHMIQKQIERASGRKVLSMIDATLDEIRRRGWKKIGVLGFGEPLVYTKPLEEMKIKSEIIDGALLARLDAAIMKVMEGRDDTESAAAAHEAIKTLRSRNVDGIILGCTEIPLLLGENAAEADLINPSQLLADAAFKDAMT